MHKVTLFSGLLFAALTACSSSDNQQNSKNSPVSIDYASAPMDLSAPEYTAHSMMMAMYRGDAEMIDAIFAEDATLRRVTLDGVVRPDGLKRWRDWVGTLEVGEAHEEIFALRTEQFENLATVWAPFVITVKGEIAGCGVNQLTMARIDGDWRVVSGMDTPVARKSCVGYREDVLAGQ